MTSLTKARETGKLEEFIAEREEQEGDAAAIEKTLGSMTGANKRTAVEKPR